MIDKILYEELCPTEFTERLNACPIAYLPLGTLEWHGPHLPLGSDIIQPTELFKILAKEVGGIVMPPLFLAPDVFTENNGINYYGKEAIYHDQKDSSCCYGSFLNTITFSGCKFKTSFSFR